MICCILDERKAAILVLLDLSAAVDTIDHIIMLTRLRDRFGITATCLAWFESYLVNRSQRIQMHDRLSAERPVVFGLPQGSVLGPLMCICYTAPLGDIARRHGINVHLYADDTQHVSRVQSALRRRHNPGCHALPRLCRRITRLDEYK